MSHDEFKEPARENQRRSVEEPSEGSECALPIHEPDASKEKAAAENRVNVVVNSCIVLFSAFATVTFCTMNMGTHRGAMRSEVQLQESRRALLEQALAEQEAYLNETVTDVPVAHAEKPEVGLMP